jgi:hypothetical protein
LKEPTCMPMQQVLLNYDRHRASTITTACSASALASSLSTDDSRYASVLSRPITSHKLKGDTKQYRLLAFYKPGNNRNANSRLAVKLIIKPSVNLNIFTRSNPPSHPRR